MIVKHNPGLEELVAQLTGERQDLPTAALAQIVLPIDQWRDLELSTRGTLLGHWRPKELTESTQRWSRAALIAPSGWGRYDRDDRNKAIAITGRGPARNAVVIPVPVASKRLTP